MILIIQCLVFSLSWILFCDVAVRSLPPLGFRGKVPQIHSLAALHPRSPPPPHTLSANGRSPVITIFWLVVFQPFIEKWVVYDMVLPILVGRTRKSSNISAIEEVFSSAMIEALGFNWVPVGFCSATYPAWAHPQESRALHSFCPSGMLLARLPWGHGEGEGVVQGPRAVNGRVTETAAACPSAKGLPSNRWFFSALRFFSCY